MSYCSQCGTELKADASFCYMCGEKVQNVSKATRMRRKRIWPAACMSVLAVAAIAAIAMRFLPRALQDAKLTDVESEITSSINAPYAENAILSTKTFDGRSLVAECVYDRDGALIEETEYKSNEPVLTRRYNAEAKLVEIVRDDVLERYDAQGNVICVRHGQHITYNDYDKDGRLIKSINFDPISGARRISVCEYHSDGRIKEKSETYVRPSSRTGRYPKTIQTYITTYNYADNGNLLVALMKQLENDYWVRTTYSYDQNQNLVDLTEIVHAKYGPDWTERKETYQYDKDGRLTACHWYVSDEMPHGEYKNGRIYGSHCYFKYDGKGRITEAKIDLYANMERTYRWQYAADGTIQTYAKIDSYNDQNKTAAYASNYGFSEDAPFIPWLPDNAIVKVEIPSYENIALVSVKYEGQGLVYNTIYERDFDDIGLLTYVSDETCHREVADNKVNSEEHIITSYRFFYQADGTPEAVEKTTERWSEADQSDLKTTSERTERAFDAHGNLIRELVLDKSAGYPYFHIYEYEHEYGTKTADE